MRINKYLAQCGVCSRRGADKLIEEGLVYINGERAEMGSLVEEGDQVVVDGQTVTLPKTFGVYAYYKPRGVTCTERDEHARITIEDEIKRLGITERVTYAGRLDRDSEGLLILTGDGDLIQSMMKGANGHEKEYEVRVNRPVADDFIKKMSEGVYIPELDVTTRKCKVKKISRDMFNIVLTQGINRQIRRMCQVFGYQVVELKRVRVVNITLDGLDEGQIIKLDEGRIAGLKASLKNGLRD